MRENADPIAELGTPTMSPSQIALWVESLNPKPKHHTVPGKPMVIDNRAHRNFVKKRPERAERAATDCVHHWRISEPSGPTCEGQCRKCGATRTYVTAPDDVNTSLTVRTDKVGRW